MKNLSPPPAPTGPSHHSPLPAPAIPSPSTVSLAVSLDPTTLSTTTLAARLDTPHSDKGQRSPPMQGKIAEKMAAILDLLGEDRTREGLLKTPERFERTLTFLTSGYHQNANHLVKDALFSERCEGMVLIRDIEVFSLCEHHLLPFFGKAHVAYLPRDKIIGLSKIPRIVDLFARRLQVQERLTGQIAHELNRILSPEGVAVIIEADHLCMMMRGIEKKNSRTITSTLLGEFKDNPVTRKEVLDLLSGLGRKN